MRAWAKSLKISTRCMDGIVDALTRRAAFQAVERAGGAERYALQRIEHLIVCQTGA